MGYALLAAAVVALGALCVYLAIRERRARRSEERIEVLMAQVMEADERSRREIAQGLHDHALQTLLAANQDLQEAAPGRAGVMRAHDIVAATIAELRETVGSLHPVTLEQGGLEAAISAVARQAERLGGFHCDVHLDRVAAASRDQLVLTVARELLTNAATHSGAKAVTVTVSAAGERICLEVVDDGHGIEPGRQEAALLEGHIGLASVVHRVEAAGGTFEIHTAPGGGTQALAFLPLR